MVVQRGPMRIRDVALLALLFIALFGTLRSWPPVATRGEAREGLVVRELMAGGDPVLPRRQGVIASKPPLYHWLAAGAVRAFGWSDTTVRLPSLLAACAMLATTCWLGLVVADRATGWLAVGILCASWGFLRSALEARVDMLFAACVTAAIAGLAAWALAGRSWGRTLLWLGAAAAVLTKGPAGAALPALVALAFLTAGGELGRLAALWSWPAATVSVLLVGGWYAVAIARGGREFIVVQLLKENVDRFAGRGDFDPHGRFAWLLMPRFFLGHLAPWHVAILEDVRRWWRGARPTAVDRLLYVWWLVVLVVFTVAAGKRAVYLLPLYPAIALLAARALLRAVPSHRGRRLVAAAVCVVALVDLAAAWRDQREEARGGLLDLARETATLVPRETPLRASTGLPENDLLVLAYALRRELRRERVTCADPRTRYLRPVPRGAPAVATDRLARGRDVELVGCPGAR